MEILNNQLKIKDDHIKKVEKEKAKLFLEKMRGIEKRKKQKLEQKKAKEDGKLIASLTKLGLTNIRLFLTLSHHHMWLRTT